MIRRNILSVCVALIILYLSLASGNTFERVSDLDIPYIDKIVHFIMYFTFMFVMIFENRKIIKDIPGLVGLSLIPVTYSIIIELLQSTLTSTRTGSLYDVVFNLAGIICSAVLWINMKTLRRHLFR